MSLNGKKAHKASLMTMGAPIFMFCVMDLYLMGKYAKY